MLKDNSHKLSSEIEVDMVLILSPPWDNVLRDERTKDGY